MKREYCNRQRGLDVKAMRSQGPNTEETERGRRDRNRPSPAGPIDASVHYYAPPAVRHQPAGNSTGKRKTHR